MAIGIGIIVAIGTIILTGDGKMAIIGGLTWAGIIALFQPLETEHKIDKK